MKLLQRFFLLEGISKFKEIYKYGESPIPQVGQSLDISLAVAKKMIKLPGKVSRSKGIYSGCILWIYEEIKPYFWLNQVYTLVCSERVNKITMNITLNKITLTLISFSFNVNKKNLRNTLGTKLKKLSLLNRLGTTNVTWKYNHFFNK